MQELLIRISYILTKKGFFIPLRKTFIEDFQIFENFIFEARIWSKVFNVK